MVLLPVLSKTIKCSPTLVAQMEERPTPKGTGRWFESSQGCKIRKDGNRQRKLSAKELFRESGTKGSTPFLSAAPVKGR